MYHIAICDADRMFVSSIVPMIQQVALWMNCQIRIYHYTSEEEFIFDLEEKKRFDLLFIEMQFGGIDGNETAMAFRKKYQDAVIVFWSGSVKPTDETFKVRPFRFLFKSYSKDKYFSEIREILGEVIEKAKDSYLLGYHRKNLIRIKVRDILYIENAKRGSHIVVAAKNKQGDLEEIIHTKEKISEIEEKFPELIFAHSSYIVNLEHVERVNGSELQLDSGEILSISRAYYKSFREEFRKSIANQYESQNQDVFQNRLKIKSMGL